MIGAKFWVIAILLAGTAGALNSRGDHDKVPPAEDIAAMPEQFGHWSGQDLPIDEGVLEVLGKGDFLNRVYTTGEPRSFGWTFHRIFPDAADGAGDSLPTALSSRRGMDL